MFNVFIKELEFELIDVSTPEKVDYIESATIVRYIAIKGHQQFDSSYRINDVVTKETAKDIILQDLNAT